MSEYNVVHKPIYVVSGFERSFEFTAEQWALACAIVGIAQLDGDGNPYLARSIKYMREVAGIGLHAANYVMKAAYEVADYELSQQHRVEIAKVDAAGLLVTVPEKAWGMALGFASLAHSEGIKPTALEYTSRLLGRAVSIPSYDVYDVMQAAYERTTTLPF